MRGIGVESILLHASDHANDRLPRIFRREFDNVNALANRVLARPELVGHVLVNDDYSRFRGVVLLVEESSTPQRNFHGFKIVAANDALIRIKKFLARKRRASFDGDRRPGKGLAQG